jgi:hypothetical protein
MINGQTFVNNASFGAYAKGRQDWPTATTS